MQSWKHLVWRQILAGTALLSACGTPTTTTTTGDTESDGAADVAADAADVPGDVTITDAGPKDVQALCLNLTPNPVDFGAVKVGNGALLNLVMDNCGSSGVCLTDLELQLQSAYVGEYNLELSALQKICPAMDLKKGPNTTTPCCLAPDTQVVIGLLFTPTKVSPSKTAQVWVKWNGPQITLPIHASATAS